MSNPDDARFILDENVDYRLLPVFEARNLSVTTVQGKGRKGAQNGALAKLVRDEDLILITRDREFAHSWKTHQIRVLYLAIHPPTAENIEPRLAELLDQWEFDMGSPFLIILQEGLIRHWNA